MAEVVKFDIGGQLYKVSRSLLEKHPNSMLAKSASEQWQEDPKAEIFIERDGLRFRYILDYLRDDKLTVPITETKEIIISDLEYYGIDFKDESINNVAILEANLLKSARLCMSRFEGTVKDLEEIYSQSKIQHCSVEVEYRSALLALRCIKE